jgi:glutathione S-transferase
VQLFQIPFSHNCVKVRKALDLKQLPYETVDINPVWRGSVKRASGQALVPALVDGQRAVADSTAILLYLEQAYPERPLLPAESEQRAECLILEHWADSTFMAVSRRLAYWRVVSAGGLGDLFFPGAPGRVRGTAGRVAGAALRLRFRMTERQNRLDQAAARAGAELAVQRLAGAEHLVGDGVTVADIALASMAAPLAFATAEVSEYPAVRELLEWGRRSLAIDREFATVGAGAPA